MEIKTIQVGKLVKYIQSDEFLQADFWPISRKRAISQAMNPRANADDIALILAYDSSRFIGYLGLIPDIYFDKNQSEKIFWISCIWILPEYKSTGVAMKLLDTAYEQCTGKILITNYIPRLKAAFIKTEEYVKLEILKGIRAYMYFNLNNILVNKYPGFKFIRPVFFLTDKMLNIFFRLRLYFLMKHERTTNRYISFTYLNEEIGKFIEENQRNSLFRRGAEEFQWMIDFPWIKNKRDDETDAGKYYFSHFSRDFRQWFIKITDDYEKVTGFLMLTLQKGILRTPYIIANEKLIPDITVFIVKLMSDYRISCIVSHHPSLVNQLKKKKKLFLTIRASEKGYITTKQIRDKLKDKRPLFYDGDGDNAFT